jgi:hypothetical protein
VSPIAGAHERALSLLGRAHGAYLRLTDWAAYHARSNDSDEDEAGNYSTEMVVIIAGIVLLAIAVLAVITKKVLDKADSLSF